VISAPYFSAVHLLHYNEKMLADNGFDGPPETLQELYDQSKVLKDAGVRTPYLAYWIHGFAEEYLMAYLLAEGITPFDDNGDPVFADDPATEDVMRWWQAMFVDGLTSPTMLTGIS
jgi:multiple sugar transport system substrate-binding protein